MVKICSARAIEDIDSPSFSNKQWCRLSYFLFRIACQRDNDEGRCVGIAHIILNDDRRAVAVLFRAGTCVSELDVVNVSAPELPVLLQMFTSMFCYVQSPLLFLGSGLRSIYGGIHFNGVCYHLPGDKVQCRTYRCITT